MLLLILLYKFKKQKIMAQNLFKKYVSISLAGLVLFITVLSILAIWEVVDIDQFMQKTMISLIVIFISSAVLFL